MASGATALDTPRFDSQKTAAAFTNRRLITHCASTKKVQIDRYKSFYEHSMCNLVFDVITVEEPFKCFTKCS